MTTESINQIIDKKIQELKITSLDVSFNELADMYNEGELIINPDYQRTFRWDLEKQSRFIESLLMEMPIPPIYVIELENGIYELIDGLQRISSYLNFRGILKNLSETNDTTKDNKVEIEDNNEALEDDEFEPVKFEAFELTGCDIIEELNGIKHEDLQASLKIKLKRTFIRMEVLRKGINPELKYHMFKRLNTGGETLEPQEIRNCTIRLIDAKFINFIIKLSSNDDFLSTISSISQKKIKKKFNEELVLRYFAFKHDHQSFKHDVAPFLTDYMEKVAKSDVKGQGIFDYEAEEEEFKETFRILNKVFGNTAFSAFRSNSSKLSGFNVYQFEAITYGIKSILQELTLGTVSDDTLKSKITEIKKDKDFISATVGGGKNSIGLLKQRIGIVGAKLEDLKNGI